MEEAAEVLARMEDVPVESEHVAQELEIIKQSLFLDAADESTVSTSPFALTNNRHLHRTAIAVGVNILAQMTGVNIITFYSDTIFEVSKRIGHDILRPIPMASSFPLPAKQPHKYARTIHTNESSIVRSGILGYNLTHNNRLSANLAIHRRRPGSPINRPSRPSTITSHSSRRHDNCPDLPRRPVKRSLQQIRRGRFNPILLHGTFLLSNRSLLGTIHVRR